jgi:osmotically inducible lipoprotein OsmB
MRKQTFIIMALCATSLSACLDNNLQRGGVGAVGGAVIADVVGADPLTGAVIGGVAGLACNELNVQLCN